jgi:AraC-like DNA-binding protein
MEVPPHLDVALRLGFADQPHLTRELRALLGRTPSEIFKTVTAR